MLVILVTTMNIAIDNMKNNAGIIINGDTINDKDIEDNAINDIDDYKIELDSFPPDVKIKNVAFCFLLLDYCILLMKNTFFLEFTNIIAYILCLFIIFSKKLKEKRTQIFYSK